MQIVLSLNLLNDFWLNRTKILKLWLNLEPFADARKQFKIKSKTILVILPSFASFYTVFILYGMHFTRKKKIV